MGPNDTSIRDADRNLVDQVIRRAPGAFESLVRQYQGLCWHIINRMVRNPDDTRELCQEAFLRVHLRLPQYRFESALKTWIAQVAYSIALRHLERKRLPIVDSECSETHEELLTDVSDEFDLEAASADEELATALRRELERLPAVQRTILMLYHFDELTIPEIGDITGLAAGTIKSHLFRGRANLRGRMEAMMGETA